MTRIKNMFVQIFSGNTDSDTIVTTIFAEPIVAQYVRIRPTEWNGNISMRLELLGCSGENKVKY